MFRVLLLLSFLLEFTTRRGPVITIENNLMPGKTFW